MKHANTYTQSMIAKKKGHNFECNIYEPSQIASMFSDAELKMFDRKDRKQKHENYEANINKSTVKTYSIRDQDQFWA